MLSCTTRSLATIHFSVQHHLLEIIEADGSDIVPMIVEELPIAAGQRYSVILLPLSSGIGSNKFVMSTRMDQE